MAASIIMVVRVAQVWATSNRAKRVNMRPRISLGRSVFQNSFNANFAIRPSTCVTSDISLQNSDRFVTTSGQVSCDKGHESV